LQLVVYCYYVEIFHFNAYPAGVGFITFSVAVLKRVLIELKTDLKATGLTSTTRIIRRSLWVCVRLVQPPQRRWLRVTYLPSAELEVNLHLRLCGG
jgi:hypothetical protein